MGPSSQSANTPTNPAVQQGEPASQSVQSEPITTPPTDSTTTSPSLPSPPGQGEPPDLHSTHLNYIDLTSTQAASPTTTIPIPAVQPICPLPSSSVTTLKSHNSYLMNDAPSTASTALNAASNPLATSAPITTSTTHNSIDYAPAAYSPGTSSMPSWTSKTPCAPTCSSNIWTTTSETPLTPTYRPSGSSRNYSAPN